MSRIENMNNNSLNIPAAKRAGPKLEQYGQEIEMTDMQHAVPPDDRGLHVHQFAIHSQPPPSPHHRQAESDLSAPSNLQRPSTPTTQTSKSSDSNPNRLPQQHPPSDKQNAGRAPSHGKAAVSLDNKLLAQKVHSTSMEMLKANADDDDLDLSSLRDLMDSMRQAAKEIREIATHSVAATKTKKKEHVSRPKEQKRQHHHHNKKKQNGRDRRSSGHYQQIQAEIHVISEVLGRNSASSPASSETSQLSVHDVGSPAAAASSSETSPFSAHNVSRTSSEASQFSAHNVSRTSSETSQFSAHNVSCTSSVTSHFSARNVSRKSSETSQFSLPRGWEGEGEEEDPPYSPLPSPPASPTASPPTAFLHVENEELCNTWPRRRGRSVSRQRSMTDVIPAKPTPGTSTGTCSEGSSPAMPPAHCSLWLQPGGGGGGSGGSSLWLPPHQTSLSGRGSDEGDVIIPSTTRSEEGRGSSDKLAPVHHHSSRHSEKDVIFKVTGRSPTTTMTNSDGAPKQRSRGRAESRLHVSPAPPPSPTACSPSSPPPRIFVSEHDVFQHPQHHHHHHHQQQQQKQQSPQQGAGQQRDPADQEIAIDIV